MAGLYWRRAPLARKHRAIQGVPAAICGLLHGFMPPAAMARFSTAWVYRTQSGLDGGMGIANLAMLTGNIGREGVGVNPLRGQNNVQGSCDMGSFPHELPGYRHISDGATARFLKVSGALLWTQSPVCASQYV